VRGVRDRAGAGTGERANYRTPFSGRLRREAGRPAFHNRPRPYQATLDQAKAQAALDQATLKRQEDLRARKVISQQDYDTAVANARKSQAAAEAAQVNLDYCYIKSPSTEE